MTGTGNSCLPCFEVHLGADDDTRNILTAAKVDDLVVDDLDHVEAISRGC